MNELLNILLSSRDRMATGQTERLRFMNALLALIFADDETPEETLFEELLEALNNLPGIDYRVRAAFLILLELESIEQLNEARRLIDDTPNSYGTGTFWKLFNQTFITLVVGGGDDNRFDALGEFISAELLCEYYNDEGFQPNITVYEEAVEGEEGVEYFFYTDEDFENPVAPGFYIINFNGDLEVVEIDINGKGLSYSDINQLCNEPQTGFQAFEYELTYCADYPNYAAEGYEELRIDFVDEGEQIKWFDVQTNIGLPNGKYILVDDGDYYILEIDSDGYEVDRVLIEDCPPVTYQSWVSEPTYCADYPNYNDLEYEKLRTYSEAGEDGMYWFEQTEGIGITLSIGEYIVNLNENDYYLLEVDSDGKELSFDEILNCPPEEEV